MKKIIFFGFSLFILFFNSAQIFCQELVSINDIITENKKYAIMHYYLKTYDNEDFMNDFIEKIKSKEDRFDALRAYKLYENDDLIYYFSGDYIDRAQTEAGECFFRIKLIDKITGDETTDDLAANLTFGNEKLWSYKEKIETGEDKYGQYIIRTKWELGQADFFLRLFITTYHNALWALANIETPYRLYD